MRKSRKIMLRRETVGTKIFTEPLPAAIRIHKLKIKTAAAERTATGSVYHSLVTTTSSTMRLVVATLNV